jgi:hypothetical protein
VPKPPGPGGSCPFGYTSSGSFCVPGQGAQDAIATPPNGNCPWGWMASGSVPGEMPERRIGRRTKNCRRTLYRAPDTQRRRQTIRTAVATCRHGQQRRGASSRWRRSAACRCHSRLDRCCPRTPLRRPHSRLDRTTLVPAEAGRPCPAAPALPAALACRHSTTIANHSVKEKRAAYVSEIQQKKEDPPAFLAHPLDFDTVIAYTRWKFPDRDVSEKLTQTLLRDINLQDFSNTPRFAKRPHYFSTPSVRPDFPELCGELCGSMSLERLQCSPLLFLL